MDAGKLLEIVKKNVDEEALAKDLMLEFGKPLLLKVIAELEKMDPIPSVSLDNDALKAVAAFLKTKFELE